MEDQRGKETDPEGGADRTSATGGQAMDGLSAGLFALLTRLEHSSRRYYGSRETFPDLSCTIFSYSYK